MEERASGVSGGGGRGEGGRVGWEESRCRWWCSTSPRLHPKRGRPFLCPGLRGRHSVRHRQLSHPVTVAHNFPAKLNHRQHKGRGLVMTPCGGHGQLARHLGTAVDSSPHWARTPTCPSPFPGPSVSGRGR
ncbi:hypothetical protein BaRGS_00013914 [Batillaria attramentaria]|uniref:Uncharacterized protein n=1 Tax=Batillaria attramentaria TaxID=370345 RepID=A0ABD0L6M4_9CAEN